MESPTGQRRYDNSYGTEKIRQLLRDREGTTTPTRPRRHDNSYGTEKIRQRLNVDKSLTDMITKKRMQWFGHVVRLPECSFVDIAYKYDFNWKLLKERPPKRCSDQLRSDTGVTLLTAERTSRQEEMEKMRHEESCKSLWSMHLSQSSKSNNKFFKRTGS